MSRGQRTGKFRSKLEAKVAAALTALGFQWRYEEWQYPYFQRVIRGACPKCGSNEVVRLRYYTPDFQIVGKKYVIEVKGRLTAQDRTKMISVSKDAAMPEVRFIFSRNQRVRADIDKTYGDWCDDYGFEWTTLRELTKEFLK